jgi:acyl-CoA thioesterase YciA
VMAQVDIAGSILPMRIGGGRIATVAVNSFVFKQPVRVGDLLSFYAEIVRVGRTSITVEVEVWAQRLLNQGEIVKVTEATLTFVAVDAQGQPRPVPR